VTNASDTGDKYENKIRYNQFVAASPTRIPYDKIGELVATLGGLLVLSVLSTLVCIIVAVFCDSGFANALGVPLLFDMALQLCCLGIYLAMLTYISEHRVGAALGEGAPGASGFPVFGVGTWLLFAMIGCRLVSHPMALKTVLGLTFSPLIMVAVFCMSIFFKSAKRLKATPNQAGGHRQQSQVVPAHDEIDLELQEQGHGTSSSRGYWRRN